MVTVGVRETILADYIRDETAQLVLMKEPQLAGSRFAVQDGTVVFVSPAMFSLIMDAENAQERQFYLSNIPVRQAVQGSRLTVGI